MIIEYDITQWVWDAETRTFYSSKADLIGRREDGSLHPESLPNGRKEFRILNPQTGGWRRNCG